MLCGSIVFHCGPRSGVSRGPLLSLFIFSAASSVTAMWFSQRDSRFTIFDSRFTIFDTRFALHDSHLTFFATRLSLSGSCYTIMATQLSLSDSCYTILTTRFSLHHSPCFSRFSQPLIPFRFNPYMPGDLLDKCHLDL